MQIINANLKEKIFVWTPPKTGSVRSVGILHNLGFKSYILEGTNLIPNSTFYHNHKYPIIEGYELLITFRNPYEQIVSFFKMSQSKKREESGVLSVKSEINSEDFENFILSQLEDNPEYTEYLSFEDIHPSHIIRTEFMFEDYLKIPYITETDYFKSGNLLRDCNIKINQSRYEEFDYKTLYNQRIADLIYYNFINVFEFGEYDKNSWKL